MRSGRFLAAALLVHACGGISEDVDSTVATVLLIRGSTEVDGDAAPRIARVTLGGEVKTGERSLARLSLDSGPQLLLDHGTEVALGDSITLRSGRAFAEIQAGEQLEISSEHGSIRASDASFSAEIARGVMRVYVVRGEVSWTRENQRGIASPGEELVLAGEVRIDAARLWHDWTGGLARPGPADAIGPAGVGMLEGRIPDEVGLARWPLVVRRLDVRVRVERDLAITEVDQLFFNPASETVEGFYRIRVPDGAVLQRFAVDRDGQLVDGYVREREQARQAYDQQVYVGSTEDPALLEWDAPGAYKARIYPIYPGETRRIVIRYAEWLRPPAPGAARMYRYPMGSGVRAPHIQELSISADVEHAEAERVRAGMGAVVEEGAVRVRRSDFRPRADFWLELVGGEGETQRAWTAPHEPPPRAPDAPIFANESDERDYFYLPLVLPVSLAGETEAQSRDLVIVADVSAATDRSQLELGRSVVESLTAHLAAGDRVAIVSSDLAIRSVIEGQEPSLAAATPEHIERLLDGLARVSAGGATDLGAAIEQAAALIDPARPHAIVYVGDGAPTVGELAAQGLLDRRGRLPHPIRLYAVAVGSESNLDLLEQLTRGGGLALRVEERAQAADAALQLLAHFERPIANDVTVVLGSGIDNAYPRGAMDVVLGEVFPVVGRIADGAPSEITVRGKIAGRAFEETIAIELSATENSTDLRLRWANERLRQILLEGAEREEIAELGTRYGLITPYTSYYVPSRNELMRMGPHASVLIGRPPLEIGAPHEDVSPFDVALAVALGPLSIAGCAQSEPAPVASSSGVGQPPTSTQLPGNTAAIETPRTEAEEAAPVAPMPAPVAEPADPSFYDMPAQEAQQPGPLAGGSGGQGFGDDRAVARRPMRAPPSEADGDFEQRERSVGGHVFQGGTTVNGALNQDQVRAVVRQHAGQVRACYDRALRNNPGLAGTVTIALFFDASGAVQSASVVSSTVADASVGQCIAAAVRSWRFPPGGTGSVRVPFELRTDANGRGLIPLSNTFGAHDPLAHQRTRCSDAADLPLDDRRALWRERLSASYGADHFMRVYGEAIERCEARTWRDRRALLTLILAQAGSVDGMVQVYRYVHEAGARSFVRAQILRRVQTPDDLRAVRAAFGLGSEVDWSLVEQILRRAANETERIRALRRLSLQYPDSFELKLRLLAALENGRRVPEAKRLADRMRADPLSDPGVRTAIGEMYLRLGEEDEARRAFSEIVEFAPLDELARRRLGDLYRAHGWYEDAYRQYQTLLQIRPDDSITLLLAQAAAGAGRVDEALRLEQGLMQSSPAGESQGISRTALLWSSVRYARLRQAARESNNERRLTQLTRRMRRSGVLREAGAVRVALVWAHPDAQLSLWVGFPGLSPSRPTDITPEFGIEALDLEEQEAGAYTIEVRRAPDTSGAMTRVTGQLVVIWNEGEDDEQVRIVDLTFDGRRASYMWTLNGRSLDGG